MSVPKSRILLAAVATVLPVAACSTDGPNLGPATQGANTSAVVVPASLECGVHSPGNKVQDGEFAAEHILVTSDDRGNHVIEHFRLPFNIRFEEGSSDAFINSLSESERSLAAVEISKSASGKAIISYPGTVEGEVRSYLLSVENDGSVSLSTGIDSVGLVETQTSVEGIRNVRVSDDSAKSVNGSYLGPGKSEWTDNPLGVETPKTANEHDFVREANGKGARLNAGLNSDFTNVNSGAVVIDEAINSACIILTGDLARPAMTR